MISVARSVSAGILSLLLLLICSHCAIASAPRQAPNTSDSVSALRAKADAGDSSARQRLTQFLLTHDSNDPNFPAVLDWLRARASHNDPEALFLLGYLFEHGHGLTRDYAQAAQDYQLAAARGHSMAQNNLASLYQHGLGVPRDPQKARDLYLASAQQNSSAAQTNLGSMYYSGDGIPPDYSEAARWFLAAAKQGDPVAQHNLGVLYFRGKGVPVDLVAAAKWIGSAATQGLPGAQADLASLYEIGSGVSKDYFAAYLWYSRAVAAGDSSCISRRDAIAHFLNRKQLDEGTAILAHSPVPHGPMDPSLAGSLSLVPTH